MITSLPLKSFTEEVEKALLRSLSPVKKDESNEAVDFLDSFLSNIKSENIPTVLSSASGEDSKLASFPVPTPDGKISMTSIQPLLLNVTR